MPLIIQKHLLKHRNGDAQAVVNEMVKGLEDLGAIYKSHNEDNLYISVKEGTVLAFEQYQRKAKETVKVMTGLVLKIID